MNPYEKNMMKLILSVGVCICVVAVIFIIIFTSGKKSGRNTASADSSANEAADAAFGTTAAESTAFGAIIRSETTAAAAEVTETVPETEDTTAAPLTETETETETEAATAAQVVPQEITLVAIGDMLMHTGVSGLAFQADGSVNYDFIFQPIAAEVASADIASVNNECIFGGDELGLLQYPMFNVFTALGDAEVRAGFNVIQHASNHVMDMNTSGVLNTLDYWKNFPDITLIGIHDSAEDSYALDIREVKGVKIAFFNYTYGINSYGCPADSPWMIDLMTEDRKDQIREELQRAEQEADFTIVYPHWGEEDYLTETADQDAWAQFFTECGADLIIGTHPHCLEPVRTITASNGNTSLCYFSLGNYISQQDETMGVLGGMAKVTLLADETGVHIEHHSTQYLVTQYDGTYTFAYVVKLENYTQELASQHGILTNNLPGNGLNEYYPFSIDTFYRIINEVESQSEPAY